MDLGLRQIFRFYKEKEYQNYRRHWCNGDLNTWQLVAPKNYLLPFQLRRTQKPNVISSVLVKDLNGVVQHNLTSAISFDVVVVNSGAYDHLLYRAQDPITTDMSASIGKDLYLEITDGVETWFSEVFRMIHENDIGLQTGREKCGYMAMQFQNTCSIGNIHPNFLQQVYLPVDIGAPEYVIKEEGEEDGQGLFHPTFQRTQKRYTFKVLAPEYVADCFSVLPLYSNIIIIDQWGHNQAVEDIEVSVEWQVSGCFALITVKFTVDFITSKGCCDDEPLQTNQANCLYANFTAEARLTQGSAEYTGGYYLLNGNNVNFLTGQYAIVNNAGTYTLQQWNGSGWTTSSAGVKKDNCYIKREQVWYFKKHTGNTWTDKPYIQTVTALGGTGYNFKGYTFRGSSVYLYGLNGSAGCVNMQLTGLYGDAQFENPGIDVNEAVGQVQACALSALCSFGCGPAVLTEFAPC